MIVMAMNNTKEQKAIHEVFPIEIRNEINDIRISLGMTWYEFLPHAAKCAKVGFTDEELEIIQQVLGAIDDSGNDPTVYPLCESASFKAYCMLKKEE